MFPAIEKRYGQPMSYWFDVMENVKGQRYPEQMAYLQENYGFSRAHANALVQFNRGSTSTRRFADLDAYLAPHSPEQQATVRKIFQTIQKRYPTFELVIAWNQPMLKFGTQYVFGVSVLKNYLLIAPFGTGIIEQLANELTGYHVNKKTIQVPSDWQVDGVLLGALVDARIAQIAQ